MSPSSPQPGCPCTLLRPTFPVIRRLIPLPMRLAYRLHERGTAPSSPTYLEVPFLMLSRLKFARRPRFPQACNGSADTLQRWRARSL